jgi:hypothetical protein
MSRKPLTELQLEYFKARSAHEIAMHKSRTERYKVYLYSIILVATLLSGQMVHARSAINTWWRTYTTTVPIVSSSSVAPNYSINTLSQSVRPMANMLNGNEARNKPSLRRD